MAQLQRVPAGQLAAGNTNRTEEGSDCERNMTRMRILLQQKETGLYFKDVGSWTRNTGEAMDFVSSTEAIEFCALNRLPGVQLVLKFEEQQYDIVLPVVNPQVSQQKRMG